MNPLQAEILRPLLTPRISKLVTDRLFNGLKFFNNCHSPNYDRGTIKLALLLVKIANPQEYFSADEMQAMNGRQRKSPGPQQAPPARKKKGAK